MLSLPYTISLIYFVCSGIYAFFALYIYTANPKERVNHVFTMVCLSLFIWSFGFSIMTSSGNQEAALYWAKVASIGWGSMYSLMLHFILIFTKKDKRVLNPLTYSVIYIPTLVNIYSFVISKGSITRFNMVNTDFGWVDLPMTRIDTSFPLVFFDMYYISFILLVLILLLHFRFTTKNQLEKKQALLLLRSFLLLLIISTIFDRFSLMAAYKDLPKLAIIGILIPISVIFYSMRRYGLMRPVAKYNFDMSQILSDQKREEFYLYMVYFFVVSGFVIFILQYFLSGITLGLSVLVSIIPILSGIGIYLIQVLVKDMAKKDIFVTIIISITIPMMILRFLFRAGTTFWVYSIIFLFIAIILNRRYMIIAVTASSMISLFLVFLLSHIKVIQLGLFDYFLRIILFFIVLYLALYLNRVYMEKLKESENQMTFQRMIAEISTYFINVTSINMDEKIHHLLESFGKYTESDRAYIFFFSEDRKHIHYSYEWCDTNIPSIKGSVKRVSTDLIPWWMEQIEKEKTVVIHDVNHMPEEASFEQSIFLENNIDSILSIPIRNKNQIIGFWGFQSIRKENFWTNSHYELLTVLSNLISDTISKIQAEEHINYMAYYDSLTNLPNRALFRQQLDKYIQMAARNTSILGVMCLDIDTFQYVNDTVGHEGGDELLQSLSKKISSATFGHGLVSRFGGDEFTIMFYEVTDVNSIQKMAEKVMSIFNKPIMIKEREFFISASAGISIYPIDGSDSDTLIRNADLTMYESKSMGKNQYNFCSSIMKDHISKKIVLTNHLHQALARNELTLHYQPQISSGDKKIIGFEALLRWNNQELGFISPKEFIPLAEQTGLIKSIGEWVIETAIKKMKLWTETYPLDFTHMAVNLSVKQFKDPHLVEFISKTLETYDLSPKFFEVEITESEDIDGEKDISSILHDIKNLGVNISIDDFGTKYSSLSRLKALPIDRMKIDMQFIHGISTDDKDQGITKSIIDLGKNLQVKVIAEGVETQQQYDFLLDNACDEIQGYYFFKPMPEEEIEKILREL